MTDKVVSALYAAATESLVSDSSANSTFEKMIAVAYSHSTIDTFLQDLKDTEAVIKKEFEISSMPGPWRSGKSVIQTAMKMNIKLVDANGSYMGKTALQNSIKAAKSEEKEFDPEEAVEKIIGHLTRVPSEHKSKVWTAITIFFQSEAA